MESLESARAEQGRIERDRARDQEYYRAYAAYMRSTYRPRMPEYETVTAFARTNGQAFDPNAGQAAVIEAERIIAGGS